jgi:hypothetical protein
MSGFGYNVLGFGANASSAAAGGASDDEFNRVSFLSHFDGTNNGVNSTFDDGSDSNHTITTNGNVTQGSFNPYGTNWAVDFSKDTNPRLSSPSSADFTLGTGDFTIEFFVFFFTIAGIQSAVIHPDYSFLTGDGTGKFAFNGTGETTSDAVANKWYHIAVTRNNNVFKIFRNGVQTATATASTNFNSTALLVYGGSNDQPIKGLMSNLRLVKGTSLYDSNFTTPTSPLTAVTNTKLLTLQSNRLVDNSASGHLVQQNTGKEAIGSFGPFLSSAVYDPAVNGASAFFDGGDGDYLSLSPQSDFAFGTGDFSVSLWVYYHNVGTFDYLIDGRNSGQTSGTWTLSINYTNGASGKLMLATGSSAILTSDTNLSKNQWYYITVSRSGTTSRMHFNGTQVAINSSDSTNYSTAPNTSYIGTRYSTQHSFDGIMGDVRVVKGTALSSYTPPTAPITAITNTKLLLNMADAQAIDSAAQNNLTLVGNAKISTGQAKFGDTSMVFDGTGDYVTVPSNSFTPFGAGDFTIECFARFDAINGKGLFQLSASYLPSAVTGPAVFASVNTNNPWLIYHGTSEAYASVSPSANTWYHVAYVRSSGVTKLYVDGTSIISQNDTTNYTNTFFVIGGGYSSSFLMDGYIDEFRISHMARYTSNFTAPTKAFADKGQ